MKMQSSIIVMLLGSANERRLSSRRVRRGTKTGDGHQNYYKKEHYWNITGTFTGIQPS